MVCLMAIPYFLAISVVSHLVLLRSVSGSNGEENNNKISCPSSFNCQHFEPFRFPLSNSSLYSSCGLLLVTCDGPQLQIQLGNGGIWYDIMGNISQQDNNTHFQSLRPWISNSDRVKQELLNAPSCHVFSHFSTILSFPNSPSISYKITPNITFFKCNKTSSNAQNFKGFQNYPICEEYYHWYYKDPADDGNPTPPYLLRNCTKIQLPIDPSKWSPDQFELHHVLEQFNFTLEMHVSEDCIKCHESGGQCPTKNQESHCIVKKGALPKDRHLKLILCTAAGTGIFVALLGIIWKLRPMESIVFWKNKTEDYRNVEAFLKTYGSLSPKRYSYSDIKKITNSFRDKLGQGGYGSVFKGKLENGCLVAVKVLKGVKGSGEEFINEVATISRTSHVNVVTLLGFCFEGHNRALIYEFMSNGSLEKFIYDGNSLINRQLGWESLYRIAVGIARGLEYLHRGCNTRILHFDIKPHNILLDDDFCPKISDFGLAKVCPPKDSTVSLLGARGTAGYIAPEVFSRHFGGVSHKSDVYSYGMMILEMVGGRRNIQVEVDRTSEIYFPHWIYNRLDLDEELELHGITNDEAKETRKMIIVGLWCIQTNPLHRPSMNRVIEMLEGSSESLQVPPKPFLSSPPRSPANSSTTLISLLRDSC